MKSWAMKSWHVSQLGMGVVGLIAIGLWLLSSVWHYRTLLIDAQVQRLAAQGEIIAGAIAVSATGESTAGKVDPTRAVPRRIGESEAGAQEAALSAVANLPWIAPLLSEFGGPAKTRARVYDRYGVLWLDTDLAGEVLRFDPSPPRREPPGLVGRTLLAVRGWLIRHDRPPEEVLGRQNGRRIPEVMQALAGHRTSMVRGSARDEVSVSVAVPIIRLRAVRGAILLSTRISGWFDLVGAIKADRALSAAADDGVRALILHTGDAEPLT
jgi:two-component system, OmpR family, sensor histidine kinase ChvG